MDCSSSCWCSSCSFVCTIHGSIKIHSLGTSNGNILLAVNRPSTVVTPSINHARVPTIGRRCQSSQFPLFHSSLRHSFLPSFLYFLPLSSPPSLFFTTLLFLPSILELLFTLLCWHPCAKFRDKKRGVSTGQSIKKTPFIPFMAPCQRVDSHGDLSFNHRNTSYPVDSILFATQPLSNQRKKTSIVSLYVLAVVLGSAISPQ